MVLPVIKHYYDEVEKIVQFGGTKKETAIRTAFYILLNEYARSKGLMVVPEITIPGTKGKNVTPDGTLKDALRQDIGYWESKDEDDDLKEEVKKKFNKGYPKDNILFEDSQTAILYQNGQKVMEIKMADSEALDSIVKAFVNYEREEVHKFRDAIEHFKQDIPNVTETLRKLIAEQEKGNKKYIQTRDAFLEILRDSINPDISTEDIKEMMIQHILTADIFMTIFEEGQYHRENNIARELEKVLDTFFSGSLRRATLEKIKHYYLTIKTVASNIVDHHEKQKFLKVIYEAFYKSYNPKAADRLGIVYTPNEVVHFMIESTNNLLYEHFNKYLEDEGVDILDPCTGTGTYICDIIDIIRKDKLKYKYENELHANEIAILPYYIANLNIEYTYSQKMQEYAEFNHLCFVDTIDNMGFSRKGQGELFGVSAENSKRIKNQNKRDISVIIGNPPYNANQQNENDNNKNRDYTIIDEKIKATFIKYSSAQKTKVYDMYSRFYRWAMDRLGNDGIIAFVSNRSFIDSRTFDGFRKCVQDEFDFAYIIDLKSDVRANPKIAGTTHNVFGIQAGVAILFLVRKKLEGKRKRQCRIQYTAVDDFWLKEKKLLWLSSTRLKEIPFEQITPDKNNNWINIADTDFEKLIPLSGGDNTIFKLRNPGSSTNRDDWVYDFSEDRLRKKIKYTIDIFNKLLKNKDDSFPSIIKWSHVLKKKFQRNEKIEFDKSFITIAAYRPFVKYFYYGHLVLSDLLTTIHFHVFGKNLNSENLVINFTGPNSQKPFLVLCADKITDLHFVGAASATQCLPLYTYESDGSASSPTRKDNITDWAVKHFQDHYLSPNPSPKREWKGELTKITKLDIFHYAYAVLHNPAYLKKYELNLKREFPRIPFYKDFAKWRDWGKELMALHIDYETVKPYKLKVKTHDRASQRDSSQQGDASQQEEPKAKLKADKDNGVIVLDENTTISDIPKEAWEYKLGNRSALEWILDQYKEKKPSDPTIAEKFNTYKFADYKEHVIDLLKRVCTVSVETVRILKEMEKNG
jgi:predicted helicase